jgi:hypothetical protein
MFEFMIGALVGVFAAIVITAPEERELEAENRNLRTALRHVRGTLANSGTLPSLARYIDRVLGDEAGA